MAATSNAPKIDGQMNGTDFVGAGDILKRPLRHPSQEMSRINEMFPDKESGTMAYRWRLQFSAVT
jgi:hypothetical protein